MEVLPRDEWTSRNYNEKALTDRVQQLSYMRQLSVSYTAPGMLGSRQRQLQAQARELEREQERMKRPETMGLTGACTESPRGSTVTFTQDDAHKVETDDAEFTKRDEIWQDIKRLLKEYPDYKLYVTGHSLGGALSTMVAFYLACDPEMPKPVTCINFAAPRIGNWAFLDGVKWLEEQKYLRMLRVVYVYAYFA